MDLNNKNGQPSMEEILASIRRIIAEEPTSANPVIDLNARLRAQGEETDEKNDFELPSIFRPSAPAQEKQPLFGRLTDAIRSASGSTNGEPGKQPDSPQRYRGVIRDSGTVLGVSNGNGGLESPEGRNGQSSDRYRGALRDGGGSNSLSSALSSLKMTRGDEASPDASGQSQVSTTPVTTAQEPVSPAVQAEPAPQQAPAPASAPAAQQPEAPAHDVQRVMAPFRDMRMSRMGGMGGSSSPSPAQPAPSTSSASAAVESLIGSGFSKPTAEPTFPAPPMPSASSNNALSLDDMHRFAAVVDKPVAAAAPPPPPAQPAPATADSMPGGIEDTTADLLRPMLRQWLAENMPRMVEKALSIELAESVKSSTRKIGG